MLRLTLLVITLSVVCKQTISIHKLTVHILYESLCPDSLKFINEQLYPVWNELAPFIDINFVPFGKSASSEDGFSFTCQHGPKECAGNKIQSCALNALSDQNAQVEYVHCFMNSFKKDANDDEMGQACAQAVGLPWDYVKSCAETLAGTQLQLNAEILTSEYKPTFVPTILYNGKFIQEAQDDSLINFHGVVCAFVEQVYPGSCRRLRFLHI